MAKMLTLMLVGGMLLCVCGCPAPQEPAAKTVDFAVGWSTHEDPAVAAETAANEAIAKLGAEPKALIFYEYYPKTVKDAEGEDKEVPEGCDCASSVRPTNARSNRPSCRPWPIGNRCPSSGFTPGVS